MRLSRLLAVVVAASAVSLSHAGLVGSYDVGAGANASNLQFDFANGDTYLYIVRYDGSITGRDLFDIAKAAQPGFFDFSTQVFPFGEALFGVSIGATSDSGFGTPPDFLDFWHYWTRETDSDPWGFAPSGFADRVVSNGSWDGWVFGSDGAPTAIPAPGAAIALAALLGRARTRRRAA
ncbi:MAG: hypothetical protein JNM94_15995 [Phycisphaerae bacterium]|nr:hypothetical protein [Phycisphaerae bacterium]